MVAERDRLRAENAKLKKEIARINGPFTCKHDPSFVGGACAACHAEALEKVSVLELQVDAIKRLVENSQWHAGGYRLISDEQFEVIFAEKTFRGCNMGCDLAHHRDCSWWKMKPIEKRLEGP